MSKLNTEFSEDELSYIACNYKKIDTDTYRFLLIPWMNQWIMLVEDDEFTTWFYNVSNLPPWFGYNQQ